MKKFLLLLLLLLSSCATGLSLTSCSHIRYIPLPESHQRDSLSKSVNVLVNTTRMERFHIERLLPADTLNPSPFKGVGGSLPRGVVILDSIYVEKFRNVEVHDTITVTHRDSIPYPVEVPIEVAKPIPRFYVRCTLGFFLLLIAIIAFIALRLYLRR